MSIVSRSSVPVSVNVTTLSAEKFSTPFLIVIPPSNPLMVTSLTSDTAIVPSEMLETLNEAGPVISKVMSDWSPVASTSSITNGIAAPSSTTTVRSSGG